MEGIPIRLFKLPLIEDSNFISVFSFLDGYGAFYNYMGREVCLFYIKNKENKINEWIKKLTSNWKGNFLRINGGSIYIACKEDNILRYFKESLLKAINNNSMINSYNVNKGLCRFWQYFPDKLKNLKLKVLFAFTYAIKGPDNLYHPMLQVQANYSESIIGSRKTQSYAIVEILKFCNCPTIKISDGIKEYIENRKDNMGGYPNLVKKVDLSKRYTIIVSGSNKNLNEMVLDKVNNLFIKFLQEK